MKESYFTLQKSDDTFLKCGYHGKVKVFTMDVRGAWTTSDLHTATTMRKYINKYAQENDQVKVVRVSVEYSFTKVENI